MNYTTPGAGGEFLDYPMGQVVAVFADAGAAHQVIDILHAEGFRPEQIGVLYGQTGADRLDASGERHGLLGRIARFFSRFADLDDQHVRRHEQELLAGHILIQVHIGDDESAKDRVAGFLRNAGGYFINYYGRWAVETLAP